MNINQQIISYLLTHPPQSEVNILSIKRKFCKKYQIKKLPTNAELLNELKKSKIFKEKSKLWKLLTKRSVRTLSGIAPIAVLTKSYPCPGNCAYCPKEKNMPTSYLSNEPAVMRAILCKFDPYKQVQLRLRALQNNGHTTDKLELIVMGGTWSYHPIEYQTWYIKECFRAANDFPKSNNKKQLTSNKDLLKKELIQQQKRNETAQNRIIGLTLETRPDYINKEELTRMRDFGCTRIEIGVQHIDDKILKLNHRGHGVDEIISATALMRDFGFKITYHLMPNLPGSMLAKDLKMMKIIYSDPRFQPDQIKLYPCVVAKGSLLYKWWQQGKWKSYTTKQLINLLIKIKSITPPWVRIIRVIRDIPEESIIAGNKITNLRQIIKAEMAKQNLSCKCIRCREAGHQLKITNYKSQITNKFQNPNLKLITRKYKVLNGTEYFLSYESLDKKILYAFCRLYLPNPKPQSQIPSHQSPVTNHAVVRELHTYGQLIPIGQSGRVQHSGLGKDLLAQAEEIAKKNNYQKISVISGIGVRPYYRKFGYRLANTYMAKKL